MKNLILMTALAFFSCNLHSRDYKGLSARFIKKADKEFARKHNLVPRGSASITNSGDLKAGGIKAIVHAATGSMSQSGDEGFEPTMDAIVLSIRNSINIAKKKRFKKIAFPLLGGGIFLGRLGLSTEELVHKTIKAFKRYNQGLEIVFVGYSDSDYQTMVAENDKIRRSGVKVVQGSITDYEVHECKVIVNAANMELAFGGGLSGFIGGQTGKRAEIDQENQEILEKFNKPRKKFLGIF